MLVIGRKCGCCCCRFKVNSGLLDNGCLLPRPPNKLGENLPPYVSGSRADKEEETFVLASRPSLVGSGGF